MSLIQITDLTFGYEGSSENIFEHVSFHIDTDWRLGFVGRNGRGKTTFLKLLQGRYEYSGTICADVDFEYFPYETENEDAFAMDAAREISMAEDWEIRREISLLNADEEILYRPLRFLSMGERAKCLLAALFLKPGSFLLIDEPTNHLDADGRRILADYLSRKKGFILVSHDRAFLDKVTDHIISVNRTDIEMIKGNFSVWDENRRRRESAELAENERLKKEIRHLTEAAKQAERWSDASERKKIGFQPGASENMNRRSYEGMKAKKMMSRAKSYEKRSLKAAEQKSGLLKNAERELVLKLSPLTYRSEQICEVKDFTLEYGDSGCKNVCFEIRRGRQIRLAGRNGSGKSSILRAVAGREVPYSGLVRVGSGLKISFAEQSTDGLCGTLREYADGFGIDFSLFLAVLSKLDFSSPQFERRLEELSDGQKKKAVIARSLCEQAHLYIWDEPLNFIDVISRMQIEKLIMEYRPTMIYVEHDEAFSDKIGAETVNLNDYLKK